MAPEFRQDICYLTLAIFALICAIVGFIMSRYQDKQEREAHRR